MVRGMATAAELKARGEELDRREAALLTQIEEHEQATTALEAQREALEQREAELDAAGQGAGVVTAIADRQAQTDAEQTYTVLPEPEPGHGFILVEAPLPLVHVIATLHPSEHAALSKQAAGAIGHVLTETGKYRRGARVEATVDTELAILATSSVVTAT